MSNEYPKRLTLRAEKVVEIRPLETGDEEALISFFAELPAESTEYLKHDVRDPEVVRSFVRDPNPNRIWPILAVHDGKVIADATLRMHVYGWRRHVGEVRVVVDPAYQKFGLATALIHELVNHASLRELRKLEAQILDNQTGARTAFERLGFREEARLKDHAMDRHMNVHDMVILTNTVDDLWAKMEDMTADMGWDRH